MANIIAYIHSCYLINKKSDVGYLMICKLILFIISTLHFEIIFCTLRGEKGSHTKYYFDEKVICWQHLCSFYIITCVMWRTRLCEYFPHASYNLFFSQFCVNIDCNLLEIQKKKKFFLEFCNLYCSRKLN